MAIQERLYTVDDVWQLAQQPENERKHFYLIDGELFWDMPPGYIHGNLAGHIFRYLLNYAEAHDLGDGSVEAGYYPADDRHTLLGPDVAFIRKQDAPPTDHAQFVPRMPDLAVEIQSPSNTIAELRRKAAVYLANGAELVWLVLPEQRGVEVWRVGSSGEPMTDFVARDGSLSGEGVLPGFTLDLERLFSS
ncbi:MAG: Uma2 family endonuclease [Chloroflexota bacterium]|nr:Uma2 family endonuclease [Chloroflexota bacterium]MDE2909019.1 Uma2 family endonuclease [Chloroflexota bacterium]